MAEHTRRPWRVEIAPHGPRGLAGVVAALGQNMEGQGFYVRAGDHIPDAKLSANALLIAAAPDLLAELENIANADPRQWHEQTRDQFQQWAQSRARAAIAKATAAPAAEREG